MKGKIIMLKGLPASGKSTWAKEQVDLGKGKVKRVNKDDLRAMLDNGRWSKANEKDVLDYRNCVVVNTILAGQTVIVDDTNLSPKHEAELRKIAYEHVAEFEVKEFKIAPTEA